MFLLSVLVTSDFKLMICLFSKQSVILSSCLQRLLAAVQKNATRGDPRSVVRAIDQFCRHKEWAMNVGDEKGTDSLIAFSLHEHAFT